MQFRRGRHLRALEARVHEFRDRLAVRHHRADLACEGDDEDDGEPVRHREPEGEVMRLLDNRDAKCLPVNSVGMCRLVSRGAMTALAQIGTLTRKSRETLRNKRNAQAIENVSLFKKCINISKGYFRP
jgi:hypothetical protein